MPPIKRHGSLKPVSRDHHLGLLLCWKIRQGIQLNVDPQRMLAYCRAFYQQKLLPHFALEEEAIFPILGNDHELVVRALAEHRRITRLFTGSDDLLTRLSQIEEELEAHIRFEERVLFNEIETVATPVDLDRIERLHGSLQPERAEIAEQEDMFWV
jgi:iron-sulfur cluster repair protein YtfE (RIC family)